MTPQGFDASKNSAWARTAPRRRGCGRLGGLLLALAPSVVRIEQATADPRQEQAPPTVSQGFYLENYVYYMSGDYGTGANSRLWYIPVTLGYWNDRFLGTLTVPFMGLGTSGGLTTVGGTPVATGGGGGRSSAEYGAGDVLLTPGYFALLETKDQPYVLLQTEVKFPTADEDKGLGTGEFDYTLRATVGKDWGDHFKSYVQLGYGFIGEPRGAPVDFRNVVHWGVGAAYKLPNADEVWAHVRGNTAIVEGTDDAAGIYLQYIHYIQQRHQISGLIGFGLTDGSPDYLLGAGYRYVF